MRLPRVRFTVRRMMIVIGSVAAVMGGLRVFQLAHLADHYRGKAHMHRDLARMFDDQASDPKTPAALAEQFRGSAEFSRVWARRFEDASLRPWLPLVEVEPIQP
jgi:hypothetical protein